MERSLVETYFDHAGRIGWCMGALASAATYSMIKRANKFLVDQGYGKEVSLVNAGVKFAGAYGGLVIGAGVAATVGQIRYRVKDIYEETVAKIKEANKEDNVEEEVEADGDGTTSES